MICFAAGFYHSCEIRLNDTEVKGIIAMRFGINITEYVILQNKQQERNLQFISLKDASSKTTCKIKVNSL